MFKEDPNKISGIYKITNLVNGKSYIGKSKDMNMRWSCHKSALRNNRHTNTYLQNSWNKYGEHNFSFEQLISSLPDDLGYWEKRLALFWQPVYNAADIDESLNWVDSEETRKKKAHFTGKKHTKETRIKQSLSATGKPKDPKAMKKGGATRSAMYKAGTLIPSFKGKKHTEEYKEAKSIFMKNLYANGFVNPNTGKTLPDWHKEAVSRAQTGCVPTRESIEKGQATKQARIESGELPPPRTNDICLHFDKDHKGNGLCDNCNHKVNRYVSSQGLNKQEFLDSIQGKTINDPELSFLIVKPLNTNTYCGCEGPSKSMGLCFKHHSFIGNRARKLGVTMRHYLEKIFDGDFSSVKSQPDKWIRKK